MQKLLRAFLVGAVFSLGVLAVPAMASLSLFTRPGTGSTAIQFPAALGDLNTLINNINSALLSSMQFITGTTETGELQITSATAFAANGTVNTGLTAVGPVGSHTTVQKWLIVVDGSGNPFFAPLF